MTPKQIIEAVKVMRERSTLNEIIHAAENRDAHLAKLEADERAKRHWATYGSSLKKGDTVFTHVAPTGHARNKSQYASLHEVGLRVREVRPRAKEIVVVPINGASKGVSFNLTVHMLASWKVSVDPTSGAFGNALGGDE